MMKFSICIPNYNYERFLGRTIQSVLDQDHRELEILVSDNASTDGSVGVVRKFDDPRVHLRVNACNVGFAGNLDRSARMASGELMIMLSSDDLMRAGALATYEKLYEHLGSAGQAAIASADCAMIDADDRTIGKTGRDASLWTESDRQPQLETLLGGPVYGVKAGELLRRSLVQMRNPFNFAATVYPAALYHKVEGYGSRLINPDKWYHWKVLSAADMAYFVDQPLFAYRWHGANQAAQEGANSSLKFLVDEYVSTLELDAGVLERIGLSRDDVVAAFVEHDVARHGLAVLARGSRQRARRILDFGRAAYPQQMRRNRHARLLGVLLALGPLGQKLAARAYRARQDQKGDGSDAANATIQVSVPTRAAAPPNSSPP
jgi:glycosyltransferase involved in cell wall biosynthesis